MSAGKAEIIVFQGPECGPLPGVSVSPFPGCLSPWQASPGAGLDVCLELAAVF